MMKLLVYFIIGSVVLVTVFALYDNKDLVLNLAEKKALEKLKNQIWDDLSEDWMKSDFYLIRWLRKTNLDVLNAQKLILQMIKWRKENNISNITFEDWSDFESDYQMSFEGHDKHGRPLLFIDLGEWDLRAAFVQGRIARLKRYLQYATEKSTQNIFKAQQNGSNVTRMIVLINAEGLNFHQHGCALCPAMVVNWAVEKENYYPKFSDETILINVIGIGAILINAVRAASEEVRQQTIAFDANNENWRKYLDKRIDRDQRTNRYGGTKGE